MRWISPDRRTTVISTRRRAEHYADRGIERDLERARAAVARIAERREAERLEPERDDERDRVHERDGIDIGDER